MSTWRRERIAFILTVKLPLVTTGVPKLQLSEVVINGESVNDKLTGNPTGISAPWNSNITIRIMSKEEDIFRQKVYRYQIEGLNDQQIESYNPELVIRSLPPGSYKIMASCTAKDGSWISQSGGTGTDDFTSLVSDMVVYH